MNRAWRTEDEASNGNEASGVFPTPRAQGDATPATALNPHTLNPHTLNPHTLASPARAESERAGGAAKTLAIVAVASPMVMKPPVNLLETMPSGTANAPPGRPRSRSKTPAPATAMTLEQYASLWVELEAWPNARSATLTRYGLSNEAAFADLHAWWSGHLVFDAALAARWTAARRAYSEWLALRGAAAI